MMPPNNPGREVNGQTGPLWDPSGRSDSRVKVSIVTVCRNEVAGIRKTAESVAGQTCRDFEWIVKDGGSTDGTREILEEYRGAMRHFESGPDAGVFDAMNQAARQAQGDWLLFLNGGDALAEPASLENMRPYLSGNGEEVVSGSHWCVWPDGRSPRRKSLDGILGRDHFYRRTINHQSAFIGRKVFNRFGPYDESFSIFADYDFFVRAVLGGVVVRCAPILVAAYDMGGMSAVLKGSAVMKREMRRIRGRYPWTYRLRRGVGDGLAKLANRVYRVAKADA